MSEDPTAHHWYSLHLSKLGRHLEASEEIRRAKELDPVSLIISVNVGNQLLFARQYDRAIEEFRKTLEMDSSFVDAWIFLGWAYIVKGMPREAITQLQKARALLGENVVPGVLASLANAYAAAGERGKAQEALTELKQLSQRRYVAPYEFATAYLGLGDKEQALAYLEKAYEERSGALSYLKVDPIYDPLRSDPRFQDLLRRLNFPP